MNGLTPEEIKIVESEKMGKIKNFSDIWKITKKKNEKYLQTINQGCGLSLYIRALTAQILWFTLIYVFLIKISPLKDFYIPNAILLIIFGVWLRLWNVIKDKIPPAILYLAKGNFFYDCGLRFLNFCIFILVFLNLFFIFLPGTLLNKLNKKYEK